MTSVGGNHVLTVGGVDKNGNKAGDWNQMVYQDVHITTSCAIDREDRGDPIMAVGWARPTAAATS